MESPIITIDNTDWQVAPPDRDRSAGLDAGKARYFPPLPPQEQAPLTPEMRHPKVRNIRLDASRPLKGASGDGATLCHLPPDHLRPEKQYDPAAAILTRLSGREPV